MSDQGGASRSTGPDPSRLFAIAAGVAVMAVSIYILAPRNTARTATDPEATPTRLTEPVAAEALVFRTRWGSGAAALDAEPGRQARPRTMSFYQRLRAYPGAPPRIPHGLTSEEFRTTSCAVCHERGGFAERFGAYAPVTPHAEYTECLQCHVSSAMAVGVPLPGQPGELVCRQCHVNPDRRPPSLVSLDWTPLEWPALARPAPGDGPPVIPHLLQLRGNCLSCHAGPGAVTEIRTSHPERGNCRQCHVHPEPGEPPFQRGITQ